MFRWRHRYKKILWPKRKLIVNFLLALMSEDKTQSDVCLPESVILCERSASKRLKINNRKRSGAVSVFLQEEFHKSQNGAEVKGIYRRYCLFKNLYLEQSCWLSENVGPHSQPYDRLWHRDRYHTERRLWLEDYTHHVSVHKDKTKTYITNYKKLQLFIEHIWIIDHTQKQVKFPLRWMSV